MYTFRSTPTILGYLVLYFSVFFYSPPFHFEVSINISWSPEILSSAMSSVLMSSSKTFLFLLWCFKFIAFIFYFFKNIHFSNSFSICSCMVSTSDIRALTIVNIIVLTSWSDYSKFPVKSEFDSDASSHFKLVFAFKYVL